MQRRDIAAFEQLVVRSCYSCSLVHLFDLVPLENGLKWPLRWTGLFDDTKFFRRTAEIHLWRNSGSFRNL